MKHMIYIGNDADLKGKAALVRPINSMRSGAPKDETQVLAQFDDYSTDKALGWFPFKAEEFTEINRNEDQTP